MQNIAKLQQVVKSLSDEQLQAQHANIPEFLILAEQKRRTDMRDGEKAPEAAPMNEEYRQKLMQSFRPQSPNPATERPAGEAAGMPLPQSAPRQGYAEGGPVNAATGGAPDGFMPTMTGLPSPAQGLPNPSTIAPYSLPTQATAVQIDNYIPDSGLGQNPVDYGFDNPATPTDTAADDIAQSPGHMDAYNRYMQNLAQGYKGTAGYFGEKYGGRSDQNSYAYKDWDLVNQTNPHLAAKMYNPQQSAGFYNPMQYQYSPGTPNVYSGWNSYDMNQGGAGGDPGGDGYAGGGMVQGYAEGGGIGDLRLNQDLDPRLGLMTQEQQAYQRKLKRAIMLRNLPNPSAPDAGVTDVRGVTGVPDPSSLPRYTPPVAKPGMTREQAEEAARKRMAGMPRQRALRELQERNASSYKTPSTSMTLAEAEAAARKRMAQNPRARALAEVGGRNRDSYKVPSDMTVNSQSRIAEYQKYREKNPSLAEKVTKELRRDTSKVPFADKKTWAERAWIGSSGGEGKAGDAKAAPKSIGPDPAAISDRDETRRKSMEKFAKQGAGAGKASLGKTGSARKAAASIAKSGNLKGKSAAAYMAGVKNAAGEGRFTDIMKELQKMKTDRKKERGEAIGEAMMKAGFAMMASKSPFFGTAVGEGGKAGMEAFSKSKKEMRADKKDMLGIRVAIAGALQKNDQFNQTLALKKSALAQRGAGRSAKLSYGGKAFIRMWGDIVKKKSDMNSTYKSYENNIRARLKAAGKQAPTHIPPSWVREYAKKDFGG